MARLFKAAVNTGLLLPIYFVPVDFYDVMCGLSSCVIGAAISH